MFQFAGILVCAGKDDCSRIEADGIPLADLLREASKDTLLGQDCARSWWWNFSPKFSLLNSGTALGSVLQGSFQLLVTSSI